MSRDPLIRRMPLPVVVGLLAATLIAGCSDPGVGPDVQDPAVQDHGPDSDPDPENPPISRPTGPRTVSGTVYGVTTEGVQPLAEATVQMFLFVSSSGWYVGDTRTDVDGEYLMSGLPTSGTVVIYGTAQGYGQLCAMSESLGEPSEDRNLWLYSFAALRSPDVELPPDHSLLVSGRVYTRDAEDGEPEPIPGASVYLDYSGGMGVLGARTWTDREGEYLFCYDPSESAGFSAVAGWLSVQATAAQFPGTVLAHQVEAKGQRIDFEF